MATDDTQNTKASLEDFGRNLDKGLGVAAKKLEEESDKAITYLNDEVVPAIRTRSSKALRIAAEQLARLADFMDQNHSS